MRNPLIETFLPKSKAKRSCTGYPALFRERFGEVVIADIFDFSVRSFYLVYVFSDVFFKNSKIIEIF
jgi:hypothetical protein